MTQRDWVVDQVTDMFISDGIKAIRMDDIATALSMSKRTLYKFFDDKEALLKECIRNFHERVRIKQKEAVKDADNVIEELIISLKNWDDFAVANHSIMTNLKKFYPSIFNQISEERYKSGYEDLKANLEKGVQQGLILEHINVDLSISIFAFSLYGIFSGKETMLPNNVLPEDAFKYVITYFFRGIATQKGIQLLDSYKTKINR